MRPVKSLFTALFAASSVLCAATASVPSAAPITVLVDFEKPHSKQSVVAMRHELEALLEPAGLKIDLKVRSELLPGQEFIDLVVFKMKGSCVMETWAAHELWDERGPLAMSYSSDGEVLHFGEVECDRIRQSLDRVLSHSGAQDRQALLGRALGLVIGHEVYHMVANSTTHTKRGVTKESLSARELLAGDLTLSTVARHALQQALTAGRAAVPAASLRSSDGFF
jgi:hypothetical protein